MTTISFENKNCLVTGAASGLGEAVARKLATAGANLTLLDIQEQQGNALAQELGAHFMCTDVSDVNAWANVADQVGQHGPLHYLHLNAGIQIAPPSAPLEEYQFANMKLENYRRMMGVNVDGVVFGLHSLLPVMTDTGSIAVTSSLAGVTPYDVDPLYSMSKHAVSGLVRSLAGVCAQQNLTINAICPGGIDTAIIPHDQRSPQAQFMTPADVAEEVLNLFATQENGKTWAKVSTAKPAWIIRAPGDRG